MNKNLFILSIILILVSCVEEQDYFINYKITNNTVYSVDFEFYPNNSIQSFTLTKGSEKNFSDHARGSFNDFFPFESIDSIKVTYNSNITVYHGSTLYSLNRSLLNRNSFINSINSEYSKEYNYNFTASDYQEALLHQ